MWGRLPIPFETLSGEQTLVVRKFQADRVRFIVVGGYAVRHYGHLRLTKDLDLVIAQTAGNVDRIKSALAPAAAESEWNKLLLDEKTLRWWDVDVFSKMRGVLYAELESAAESVPLFDSPIQIVSISHLKKLKELAIAAPDRDEAKRLVDQADLNYLEGLGNAQRFG